MQKKNSLDYFTHCTKLQPFNEMQGHSLHRNFGELRFCEMYSILSRKTKALD